jgi:LysR family nitrogen assimilation transcriptional regulator
MSIDTKRVEYLMLISAHGSISKAASILGMAQPSLGRQIQKLEEECHARLLYRHGRGVLLTPEGMRLVEGMRPLLRQIEALANDLAMERSVPKGHVIVGITPAMCALIGVDLVVTVGEKYPEIGLSIVSGYSGYINEWIVGGRVDLALLHDERRSIRVGGEFLGSAGLYLVSPRDFVAPGGRDVTTIALKDLAGLPLVLPTANHGSRRSLAQAAADVKAQLNVRFEMASLSLMKELVMAGHAHTILALPTITRELEAGLVRAHKLVDPPLTFRLVLATSLSRPFSAAMQAVSSELKSVLRTAVEKSDIPLDITLA